MATLPYGTSRTLLEQPAGDKIRRALGRGTRSFSWAAGLAWVGLTFLWSLLRQWAGSGDT